MTSITGPRPAGQQAAHDLITTLADTGMSSDRMDAVAQHVLGARYDRPTPVTDRFYAAFDRTAAIYVADLREPEADNPRQEDRTHEHPHQHRRPATGPAPGRAQRAE
jgi:hypothetical protein